jgi:RHS repeat-associated protein
MRFIVSLVKAQFFKPVRVCSLLVLGMALSHLSAFAGIEPYSNSIRGVIKKGDTLVVKDEKFRSAFFNWNNIERQKTQNIISFRLFQDTNAIVPKLFSCELKLKIEYYASADQPEPLIIKNINLGIKYNADSLYANKLLDTYSFENGYWVKLTVEGINSKEFGDKVPPFLEIVSQIIVDRTYKHDPNKKLNTVYSFSGTQPDAGSSLRKATSNQVLSIESVTTGTATPNEMEISWSGSADDEYDIEWTTLDNFSGYDDNIQKINNSTITPGELNELFRFKSTRITTHGNQYAVTLTHYNDYLFFRIRTVHYTVDGLRDEGAWDYSNGSSGYAFFPIPEWHEENFNWQFTATYAEEAKKKEVISYFDGTLRSRQTVTISDNRDETGVSGNEDKNLVVQEDIYDEFGRVVGSTLPAPKIGSVFQYYPNLNTVQGGQLYTWKNIVKAECESAPDALSNIDGAGNYYSSANTFLSNTALVQKNPFYKYIPDAEGYPLSVTLYTPDNTGRIKVQGGVGKVFQPKAEGSRTTKYFYGKPEQDELDKIFGNDVGYAEHYLKNMVVDPNYQVSVSYIDASGKTIATALSGDTPENLESLPAKPPLQQQTKEIITPGQFQYDFANLTLSATTTYLSAVKDNSVTLSFDMEKLIYSYQKQGEAWTICSNCYYDLSISIFDDCGTSVFNQTQTVVGSQVADCNATGLHSASYPGINFDKVGEYQVKFEFALSKKVIEKYTDDYIQERQTHGDWKSEFQFLLEHTNLEDFTTCLSDCSTCKEELGTKPDFIANAIAQFGTQFQDFDASQLNTYLDGLYNNLYAHCQTIQASCAISPCDRYKKLMLDDVSPGGQYALFKYSTDNIETTEVTPLEPALNVIYQYWREQFPVLSPDATEYKNSIIEKSDGTYTSPYDIAFTLTDLVVYWKDEWAEKFLSHHPEHCKLQFCEQNSTYYTWDYQVTEEITSATSIPTHPATLGAQYDYNNAAWLVSKDPFFAVGAPGVVQSANMIADLQQFSTRIASLPSANNKSLIQFVDYSLYCADHFGSTNGSSNTDYWTNCTPAANCRIPDREWDIYKDYYFQLKEKYYEAVQNATTCNGVCPVGTPVSYSTGSCPLEREIAILPGSPLMDYSCPAGSVPVIFKNLKGKANGTVVAYLQYSAEFNDLGLPTTISFTNGQSEVQLCISDQIPLSAIYVDSISCGGASTPPSDYCPFGNGDTVTISDANYQRPSPNIFTTSDSNVSTTYTIITGRADQPPADNCASGGTLVSKTFYSCYRVYVPGNSVPVQYYDVWVTICNADACANALTVEYQSLYGESGATVYEFRDPQNSCSYTKYRYYIFEGYSSSNPPPSPGVYCEAIGMFYGFFDCIKFINIYNGTVTTHTNVWLYYCEGGVNECGGFQQQGQSNSVQNNSINAQTDSVANYSSPNGAETRELIRQRILHRKEHYISSGTGVYSASTDLKSMSGTQASTNSSAGTTITPANATLSCSSGGAGFSGSSDFTPGYLTYDASIDMSAIPQGATITMNCQAFDVPNRFTIQVQNGSGVAFSIWLGNADYSGPWGNSVHNNATQIVTFIKGSASLYNLHVETSVYDQTDAWQADIYVDCSTAPPPPACNPFLVNKKSRFGSVTTPTLIPTDVNTLVNEGLQAVKEQIQTSCEGQAENWMSKLEECLRTRYPVQATYDAKKAELKQKLIEVCTAGGDIEHPDGAATTRPGTVSASGYTSFKQVILAVLGISSPDMLCNPWILEAYAWDKKPQAVRQSITSTSPALCQRLDELKQQHITANSGLSFYDYLKQTFGDANVTLTESDITALTKGCDNCRYLLEKEVPMPVFLEPAATGCITATGWNAAITAFNNEFAGGILNTADVNYGDMLSNYLNQRWGFTLTYYQYKKYEADLVSRPQTLLCNKPVYEPVIIPPYQCINSLLSNAIANGRKAYTVYLEQEKKIFRTNYVNTCLIAKSTARLSIKQQTYYYTLYYYDQAGNLVKTVPPAGVDLLSGEQLNQVRTARDSDPSNCSYTGPMNNTDKAITLASLSSTLASPLNRAIEMWLYNEAGGSNQVLMSTSAIAGTPVKRYMFHSCLNGNLLNIDIYSEEQTATNEIELVLSNHVTVDVTSLQPLRPWVHVVIQGSNMATGLLQVFVNGTLRTAVAGNPAAGCSWEINSGSPVQLPENIATLKHIRFYDRLLNVDEIAANAAQSCLGYGLGFVTALQPNNYHWGRFNAPPDGGGIIVNTANGAESQSTPMFPAHRLATTYLYNSMGQVTTQTTPDAGTSNFWYDRLGRLIASQNAEQLAPANGGAANRYSYTVYDEQSRITEVGEKESANISIAAGFLYDNQDYLNFLAAGINKQVTQTIYDVPSGTGTAVGLIQENLRKRVSSSQYKSLGSGPVEQGTYYSYDLMGNVKVLWQQVEGLGTKKIDYQYDLASGKVNAAAYQPGQPDAFYYQYKYDAENKLLKVLTNTTRIIDSRGNIRLEDLPTTHIDAEYKYYLHGPLARTEIGQNKVQGIDYAYTVQGWLKGINGSKLDPNTDIGEDGKIGSTYYPNMGRDVMAYTLGYYDQDYKPIGGTGANAFNVGFAQTPTGFGANLYNGNISHTTVALNKINNGALAGYTYKYDQLNRLMGMQFHTIGANTNWNNTPDANSPYAETYHYDANGNISALTRNGNSSQPAMDNLKYWYYYKDANGTNKYYDADPTVAKPLDADKYTNKLAYVQDAVGVGNYTEDIDNQSPGNFLYDKIGNLVKDVEGKVSNIGWTVYGKIKTITKTDNSTLQYNYDAGGNRISKVYFNATNNTTITTYYVRDAQGNTLALYEAADKKEQYLYGSSRVGVWKPGVNGGNALREYELTNHLGNVMATISDQVTYNGTYNVGDVITQNDYYPFGMMIKDRQWKISNVLGYRYGFNGKEEDNEVSGEGNQYDYGFRIYDPRLGKFLSVDPLTNKYPELTPYQFASNMPIIAIDLDGQEAKIVTIYHSMSGGKEFYRVTQTDNSVVGRLLNITTTIHRYAFSTRNGIEYRQVGPAELTFNEPVNFQTGRIDLSSQTLGKLSEKYESAGPGTVSTGIGDYGGVSYGSWQLATKMGSPQDFLENEGKQYKNEFGSAKPGSNEFSKIWKAIAAREPEAFKNFQHAFIKRRDYDQMVNNAKEGLGLDINSRSSVLQDVVWSTAVQHGGASNVIKKALADQEISKLTDEQIIKLIYAERGRKNSKGNLAHFTSSSKSVQKGVSKRYEKEMKEALDKLKKQ